MNARMQHSKQGEALTESFEGFRSKAYPDSGGVWTIAFGHTRGVKKGDTCTRAQGVTWLVEDYKIAEDCVNDHVEPQLNQNEFDAVTDFVFNLGCAAFESSTMLKMINASDFIDAAREFEKWDHVGGKIVGGLLRRRLAEETEFNTATA